MTLEDAAEISLKWQWLVLAAFVVFAGNVSWWLYAQHKENRQWKDNRPKPRLELAPHPTMPGQRLRLHNDGGGANFTVRAITQEDPDAWWVIRWRGSNDRAMHVDKGSHELLEVVDRHGTREDLVTFSTAAFETTLDVRSDRFSLPMPSEGFHIHVQVTAEPPMYPNPTLDAHYVAVIQDGQLKLEEPKQ